NLPDKGPVELDGLLEHEGHAIVTQPADLGLPPANATAHRTWEWIEAATGRAEISVLGGIPGSDKAHFEYMGALNVPLGATSDGSRSRLRVLEADPVTGVRRNADGVSGKCLPPHEAGEAPVDPIARARL